MKQTTTQRIESLENSLFRIKGIFLIMLVLFIILIFEISGSLSDRITSLEQSMNKTQIKECQINITQVYEILGEAGGNCGSNILNAYSWENNGTWSYFSPDCDSKGYCKYNYKTIEECLNDK